MQGILVLALIFGVVGPVGAAFVWRQRVRAAALEALAQLAREFGLTLENPQHATGAFGTGWLDVSLTSERRGSGEDQHTVSVTRYRIRHGAPLRMGLKVNAQTQFFGDIADALGLVSDIRVGRKELDDVVRIGAVDAAHASAVLTEGEVTRALISARNLGRFYVNDAEAFAQHDRWVADAATFRQYAGGLRDAVDALAAARARNRAAWETELDRSWSGLAASEGFSYAPQRSALSATSPSGNVELAVEIVENRLVTTARVSVPRPLGYGIELYRTGTAQTLGKLFGAQDLTLGVPAIDEPYTIKAQNEAGARPLLLGISADLVTIHDTFPTLTIVDGGLTASGDGLLLDPIQTTAVLRALLRVCDGLAGSSPQIQSAFR